MAKWFLDTDGKLRRRHDNIDEVKKELEEVAEALGLTLSDHRVTAEWCERANVYTDEVAKWLHTIQPMIPVKEALENLQAQKH
ncbi:MAG: hypothetical protein IJT75_01330 [Bacteroidaceae bacterium]|nr:hypothetical protein [Bacteroidaceae bacterium]